MRHDERRRGQRTTVDLFVEIRDAHGQPFGASHVDGEHTALHPATDLSTTGLYLLASDDHGAIDPGRPLELELTLPSGAIVKTQAHIAYIDDRMGQRGIGLEFIDLAPAHHLAIERFVDASHAARSRLG